MRIYSADTKNFLRKLTVRRIANATQVLSSYYFSKAVGKSYHRGMPISLSIEPTTACNLRCPECPSGLRSFTRATGNLNRDFFRTTLDQVAPDLLYLLFYFQGEPYINPNFLDMVRYASDKNIYTITSTNGHFLDEANARATVESGLNRLIISIDGTTQETYQQYRREGQLQQVLSGTKNVVSWKRRLRSSTPHIVFQFLVVRPNQHQIADVNQLAQELGVDEVKFKTAQIYDYQNGHPLIPTIEKYARYKQLADGTFTTKHAIGNHCWKMWHSCVITWDGRVVPCCFDKDASFQLGNLHEQSFVELWKSKPYQFFRNRILHSRKDIDICSNCTEGARVWA